MLATNVTRLERLLRDADCFIGIYPYPGDSLQQPDRSELEKKSRYFRLELDLAERSSKPAIAFIDERYGDVIAPSAAIIQCRFEAQEVSGTGSSTRADTFERVFAIFCEQVAAWREFNLARVAAGTLSRVGILLPPKDDSGAGYRQESIDAIAERIRLAGLLPLVLPWPPRLDMAFARNMRDLDWAIVDLGPKSSEAGIAAYLHGRFVPSMRLLQTEPGGRGEIASALTETLFGAIEVGYEKDIVHWHDQASLLEGVSSRLTTIGARRERIATEEQAVHYFQSAALRKERVFFSYAGRDAEKAAELIAALNRRFQEVFDYRDGGGSSIPPGTRWMDTVFDRLAAAPIGIPLISEAYLASGNCRHEAEQMVAYNDAGRMTIIPLKLEPGTLELPPWIGAIQYLRRWEHPNADSVVAALISSFDANPRNRSGS